LDNDEADLQRRGRRPRLDVARIDRLPPHSLEAEQGILGCILLDAKECIPHCIEHLPNIDVFYDLRHRTIYDALVAMHESSTPIDTITVQQWLKDNGQLDGVGGLHFLSQLPDAVPSAANLSYYAEIVREKFQLRQVIHGCTGIVTRAYEATEDVEEILDDCETQLLELSKGRIEKQQDHKIKDLVRSAIVTIEDYHKRQGVIQGIPTGFIDLDKMSSGLEPGYMYVIAARPSAGKTSLAMNIAESAAIDHKVPTAIFSLEMTAESLVLRMICSRGRVNLRNIRDGFLAERDFPKLTTAAGKIANAPIYIDDSSGLSIMQLRAKARRMAAQYGIKLFVIDYLQLLHSTNRRADNRQQEIADISGGIKGLAKDLKVPVIVLSQLNREMEKNKRKPQMSDLRESGAIEQDADFVGLLYKPHSDNDEDAGGGQDNEAVPINLYIAKQRNGPTGDVCLTFLKAYTRFESAARISGDDVPDNQLPGI
jgi:replicative DNA helicase